MIHPAENAAPLTDVPFIKAPMPDRRDFPLDTAENDARSLLKPGEPPCPACGGSMRFCECMDDPFAAVPDTPIPPGVAE